MAYKIEIRPKVALTDDPRPSGAKRLSVREEWKIRVGNYRILYLIEDERLIVVVVKVGHRSDVYRRR